jgi:hypothetical protein
MRRQLCAFLGLLLTASLAHANPPVASYLFPAGGQRGTTVKVRVGGLFLYSQCGFEMLGPGVQGPARIRSMPTLFFEGPLLPLPDSQQAEDYPQDMAAEIKIGADAPLGPRRARLWTAEGAASGLQFVVGDLPEVVEDEIDGDPIAVPVQLPVTINGRIFPREDIDLWEFQGRRGQPVTCEVTAARIGSPLDAHLAILDTGGRVLAENDDRHGPDPLLRFVPPGDGTYRVQIRDVANKGGQAYVYRLTLTADPYLDRVYPLGGRRGERVKLELLCQGVPTTPVVVAIPGTAAADYLYRYPTAGKLANPVLLDVDDLPEVLHTDQSAALSFTAPAMLNGRIGKSGDVNRWSFTARKGEVLSLQMRAVQLGSPLLGVVTITDAAGKQLGRAEAGAGSSDPQLTFTAPGDGTYTVQVAERFTRRGGAAFAYRLRVSSPPGPDFRLRLTQDTSNLERPASQHKMRIQVERDGFAGPIELAVEGLPRAIKAAPLKIPSGQITGDIVLSAEPSASIGASRLMVRGTAVIGNQTFTRTATFGSGRAQPEVDSVLLAVTPKVPFKVSASYLMRLAPRGSVLRRKYRIDRGGYTGPLEVRLADRQARHLQGAHGPTLTVPADTNEFEYPLMLPPWMETGRTCRVCVMTIGKIKDGDSEHEVCYSAIGQNDQIVSVVETGRLGVELETGSLEAAPGRTVELPVKVTRAPGLVGPARVELVLGRHVHGVAAEPLIIPAERDAGRLTLHFGQAPGPFNLPATVRATVDQASGPLTAEARLELTAEK